MGAKGEALARQLEAGGQEATALLEKLIAKSGTVFAGVPPMSAEDLVKRALGRVTRLRKES